MIFASVCFANFKSNFTAAIPVVSPTVVASFTTFVKGLYVAMTRVYHFHKRGGSQVT